MEMDGPYQEFLKLVRTCFDESDCAGDSPKVYLYEHQYLHVTIATLLPLQTKGSDIRDKQLEEQYIQLLEAAMSRPTWPSSDKPLTLSYKSTQLGANAGILLWEDSTGGITAMRKCLRDEAESRGLDIHGIPGIFHTTFIRFPEVPDTDGKIIQFRYQTRVVPTASTIFQKPLKVSSVKLVCEKMPYMHIPDNEDHVLLKIEF